MGKLLVLIGFLFSCFALSAQTVAGRVIDAQTKKAIPYAKIFVVELSKGVLTDSMGNFKLDINLEAEVHLKISALSYAQQIIVVNPKHTSGLQIELKADHISFDEVTIASSMSKLSKYSIVNVERMEMANLNEIATSNLGQALAKLPGMSTTSLGAGINKPVVRGLSGSRVLTYLNGLRIENQQWGGDHGLGVNELGVGSVELIKGPASLLYGADALGGVVYLIDENYADHNTIETRFKTAYEHVNGLTKNEIAIKYGGEKLRLNLFANYNNAADYQLPSSDYLKNSRYFNRNIKMALGYNKGKWVGNLRYNFSNARFGIPGHTHDSLPVQSDFFSQNSKREKTIPAQVINNHYFLFENAFYLKRSSLKVNLGQTFNHLQEFEEKITKSALNMHLNTSILNARYNYRLNEKTEVIIGTQAMYQLNINDKAAEETIIPDARQQDLGVYAVLKGNFKSIDYQAGLRYDIRHLQTDDSLSLNRNFESVNYSVGLAKLWKSFALRLNLSTGFRAPHSSELLADGVHHGTFRYELGKRDLKSEKATQIDVGIEWENEHLEVLVSPFYNSIADFIYINPTQQVIDGYKLFEYQQASRVKMYGGDVKLHFHPHFVHNLHLTASFSYIYSELKDGSALALQPQNNGGLLVKYSFESSKKLELSSILVSYDQFLAQNRTASYETKSSAYGLLNFGANLKWKFAQTLNMQLGVKNILNEKYVPHLSQLKSYQIPSPGRNFYISISIQLKNKIK